MDGAMPPHFAPGAMNAPVPQPAPTDDALLILFANGDRDAAHELTQRLAPLAYGVAMRMLGDRGEAEDVTQEDLMSTRLNSSHSHASRITSSTW